MRPTYETPADRDNQAEVITAYCDRFGWGWIDVRHADRVDYVCTDKSGVIREVVEVKCRTNPSDQYGTYMLSSEKYTALLEYKREFSVEASLLVRFTDGIFRTYLPAPHVRIGVNGRRDRGDPADIEIVAYIPMGAFTPLK